MPMSKHGTRKHALLCASKYGLVAHGTYITFTNVPYRTDIPTFHIPIHNTYTDTLHIHAEPVVFKEVVLQAQGDIGKIVPATLPHVAVQVDA